MNLHLNTSKLRISSLKENINLKYYLFLYIAISSGECNTNFKYCGRKFEYKARKPSNINLQAFLLLIV